MKVVLVLKGNPDQFGRLPIFRTTQYRATKEEFSDGKLPGHASMREMLRAMVVKTEFDLFEQTKKYRDAEFYIQKNALRNLIRNARTTP